MPIIEKTFWLIAIAVTFLNAQPLRVRAKSETARNPALKEGYGKLLKGYLIFLNLPWLVMGIGILVGGAESVFEYFDPRVGNVYVLAFHVTLGILWALAVFWIYFVGGAEFLIKHPGVINFDIQSPLVLKLLFALMLGCGIAAEIAMWSRSLPSSGVSH